MNPPRRRTLAVCAILTLVPCLAAASAADPTPRPLGFHAVSKLSLNFVDQSTSGPGQLAPEAGGFIDGLPLSPNTPYDLFSSAPQVPGVASVAQLISAFAYGFRKFDVGVTTGAGYVRGSVTNASYWSESLLPTLNLHLGSQALPYRIAFPTTVPFGTGPTFLPYPQGVLPTSTLSGQQQTIAGVRAAFHAIPAASVDAVAEIGRAWYDASPVARPGTSAPGGYYHLGLSRTHGRVTASADYFRMEPRYATAILPYGVPENQWSAAFAWPGQWLKSNYQLVDNSTLGVNRQGYRLRYYVDKGPLEVHAEFVNLKQIDAETRESATRTGFIDGYYLPQFAEAVSFGTQKRTGLWIGWHPRFGDLTLDIVDDTEFRPFSAAHPEDMVSYEVPQAVATFSRHLSPAVVGAVGLGRYGMKGAFAEPIDFAERLVFAGVQVRQTAKASLLATFRRTAFAGITTFPASPRSPDFTGSTLIVEQRYRL